MTGPDDIPDVERHGVLVIGMGAYAFGRERRAVRALARMPRLAPHFLISRWEDGRVSALLDRYGFPYEKAPFGYLGTARMRWTLVTLLHLPLLLAKTMGAYRRQQCRTIFILDLGAFVNALPALLWLRLTGARLAFYLGDTPLERRLNRAVGFLVDRMADAVVVNAASVRHGLERIGVRRVAVVHNGVDLERYAPGVSADTAAGVWGDPAAGAWGELAPGAWGDPAAGEPRSGTAPVDLRRAAGFPESSLLVGFVGQLTENKGIEDFLDAAAAVISESSSSAAARGRDDVSFVIIGGINQTDPYQRALPELIRRKGLAGRVWISGWMEDVAALYAQMQILVVPSRHDDPAPNTVIEAMAAGLPVVATNVGGTPELMVDGVTGFLVDRRAPDQLALRITHLLNDPALRRRMGAAGRARAERRFDADVNAAAVECLLRLQPAEA